MDPKAHIARQLHPDETLLCLTETDLGHDGRFGRRWLAITPERLLVYSENGRLDAPDAELPLASVKELKAVHLVGQVALEAELGSRRVELLRCTNSLSERFAKVAKAVTDACKNKTPLALDLQEDARECLKCGRPLPEAGSFCPVCLKKRTVLARLWQYMRPYKGRLALASGAILAATLLELVPPYLTKILVDNVLLGPSGAGLLLTLVGALIALRLLGTVLAVIQGRLGVQLGTRLIHDVREDFYRAIQRLSLRRYDKLQTGTLIGRLTGDTTWLNFFFSDIGAYIVPQTLLLFGIAAMLFILDWRLALFVLVPTPFVVGASLWFFRRLQLLYMRLWQRHSRMSAQANDSISGLRAVKAFSQEARETERFALRSRNLAGATSEAEQMWATAFPALAFLTTFGSFIVWYVGGIGVKQGQMTVGTLTAFLAYVAMFYGPVHVLTRYGDFMNRAMTAAQRLFEIMDAEQEVYDDPAAQPMPEAQGGFEFENVHFGYLKDKPVLKGASFKVEPGEMIGLVGPSGAGKTTITSLICRFYDVDEGTVYLDGVDVRKVRLRDLRRHIGVVPQDCFLFDGTIFDNIAYGRPGATQEDVIRAAIAANAHGFVMRQPEAYETRVGERGARISGGEKQRIAIARALLHDPKILILDEATSSVDTETEEQIQQALTRLTANRTTFAIAHRLSTLRHANKLLVIEEGKVAEFGTHDELLEKKGIYHRLVELQSKLSAMTGVSG